MAIEHVSYQGPRAWPNFSRFNSVDLFEIYDANSYLVGLAILTNDTKRGWELWESKGVDYQKTKAAHEQFYYKVNGLDHLSNDPDSMLANSYTTIQGWFGKSLQPAASVGPPGLSLPATITAIYQGNAQLTSGFSLNNLDFALHYYCSGYKWNDILLVRSKGSTNIWVYKATDQGVPDLNFSPDAYIASCIDDCLSQAGISVSFGTPKTFPAPVHGPTSVPIFATPPTLPSPPQTLPNPVANISSPFFGILPANSKLPGIKLVEQYHIPKPASGPARCTSCNEPNEYQDGPFLCTQCKMRQKHWT